MNRNTPETISQKYRSEIAMPGYKFVISYAEKLDGETVEVLHKHLEFEVYYVLANRILSRVADREFTLECGDLILLAPDVEHHTVYEPQVAKEYFVLIFSIEPVVAAKSGQSDNRANYEEVVKQLQRAREASFLTAHGDDIMARIIAQIGREMLERRVGWQDMVNSLLHHFFLYVLRALEAGQSSVPVPSEHLNLGVEATKFMHGNYHRQIAVEDAAAYLGISPRHVNRAFRQVFGSTFSKTLSLFRLNYAKKLLVTTDSPIEKIAELVGFKSSRTLFKLFQQYEGMTVSDYRSHSRKKKPGRAIKATARLRLGGDKKTRQRAKGWW
ncbi:MAG: AraC family transcriptional regulator [Planctomycetaceae bacterium]|nr:AraC family transcriptional regulator [Planctomycetaceae bacterium]